MTEELPIACSLGAGDLKQRLADMAAIGHESLVGRESKDGRHVLRFRADPGTRARLERIVAAEAGCCSFLDLRLREDGGQLVLSIAAPADGRVIAEGVADAFTGTSA